MPLPPWTVELLRRGVNDLAKQVSDPDRVEQIKQQATRLVEDLPRVAREKVDAVLQQAQSSFDEATSRHTSAQGTLPADAVNASGCLLNPDAGGLAWIPVQSIAAAQRQLGESWSGGTVSVRELNERLSERLSERGGVTGWQGFVVPSIDHALAMLTNAADLSRIWVPRWSAIPMNTQGDVLADRVRGVQPARSEFEIHEFGSSAMGEGACTPDSGFDASRDYLLHLSQPGSAEAFSNGEAKRIVVMPQGRWFHGETVDYSRIALSDSVEGAIRDGVSGVVLGTGVLTGCAPAAVLIADERLAMQIQAGNGFSLRLGAPCLAAMVAESMAEAEKESLPVDVLINAPEENLVSRAERLAIQLSALDRIGSVRVTDREATIGHDQVVTLPSRQVELAVHGATAQEIHDRLRQQSPAILASLTQTEAAHDDGGSKPSSSDQRLSLDLRWVSSDQQIEIANCLTQALS
ncbi:MAG: hypothetical protein AAGD07_11715 [Planctomycetota bacterium]